MKTSKVGAAISCMTSVLLLFFSLVSATPIPDVRTLYLISEDRSFNPAYQTAISDALLNLQDWYADQLGGKTFTLSSPIVEPVFTGKPSTSYSSTSFTTVLLRCLQ